MSAWVEGLWEQEIVPELETYIAIPNQSPLFDPDWEEHGFMEQAVQQIEAWCRARPIEGLEVEVVRLPGRTPLIWMEIPGEPASTKPDHSLLESHPFLLDREGIARHLEGAPNDPWIAESSAKTPARPAEFFLRPTHKQDGVGPSLVGSTGGSSSPNGPIRGAKHRLSPLLVGALQVVPSGPKHEDPMSAHPPLVQQDADRIPRGPAQPEAQPSSPMGLALFQQQGRPPPS